MHVFNAIKELLLLSQFPPIIYICLFWKHSGEPPCPRSWSVELGGRRLETILQVGVNQLFPRSLCQAAHHRPGIRALGLRPWDFTQDCYCSPVGTENTVGNRPQAVRKWFQAPDTGWLTQNQRSQAPGGRCPSPAREEPPGSHDTQEPPPGFTEWTGSTQDPTFAIASSGWGRARRWR